MRAALTINFWYQKQSVAKLGLQRSYSVRFTGIETRQALRKSIT